MGAVADNHLCHGGHGDRLAGGDHRGLLDGFAGGATGVPTAPVVRHTFESEIGQIYVPWINGVLVVAVLVLVVSFRSSAALAYTYGMAVAGTIAITTLLFLYIADALAGADVAGGRRRRALLTIDVAFLAANVVKVPYGAWFQAVDRGPRVHRADDPGRRGSEIAMAERNRLRVR